MIHVGSAGRRRQRAVSTRCARREYRYPGGPGRVQRRRDDWRRMSAALRLGPTDGSRLASWRAEPTTSHLIPPLW